MKLPDIFELPDMLLDYIDKNWHYVPYVALGIIAVIIWMFFR